LARGAWIEESKFKRGGKGLHQRNEGILRVKRRFCGTKNANLLSSNSNKRSLPNVQIVPSVEKRR